jgi:hypothetical protein
VDRLALGEAAIGTTRRCHMVSVRSPLAALLGVLAVAALAASPALAQVPDHGTGEVACGTVKKGIYTVSQRGAALAVTLEINADPGCRAVVLQNGILNTREAVPPRALTCGSTNSSTSVTCLGVQNLSLACEGGGQGSCRYRIVQIDSPGAAGTISYVPLF